MKKLKEHIAHLNELLEKVEAEFKLHSDSTNLSQKQIQLKSIEQTIQKLSVSEIPVPDELRDLKLRLVDEVETGDQTQKLKNEILNRLQSFIETNTDNILVTKPPKLKIQNKSQVVKNSFNKQVRIIDLLEARVINTKVKLYRKYKGKLYRAAILPNGLIELNIDGKYETFKSPSIAAGYITGLNMNGWFWWRTSLKDKTQELDLYRQKYLRKKK